MTWDEVALGPPERSAGKSRRNDAALPFPFYDFTEWFFEPAKKPGNRPPRRSPPAVVPGPRGHAALWLFRLAGAITRPGSASDELNRDWEAVLTESQHSEILHNAWGMVVTALCRRVDHAAQTCWRPVDYILRSRLLSNLLVAAPWTVVAWVLFRNGGIPNLLGHTEAVAAISGALRQLIVLGRWWRNTEPPDPKTRHSQRPKP
jgi:hypothetical protein